MTSTETSSSLRANTPGGSLTLVDSSTKTAVGSTVSAGGEEAEKSIRELGISVESELHKKKAKSQKKEDEEEIKSEAHKHGKKEKKKDDEKDDKDKSKEKSGAQDFLKHPLETALTITGKAVKKAGKAFDSGIKNAVELAGDMVNKSAHSAGHVVKEGIKSTANMALKVTDMQAELPGKAVKSLIKSTYADDKNEEATKEDKSEIEDESGKKSDVKESSSKSKHEDEDEDEDEDGESKTKERAKAKTKHHEKAKSSVKVSSSVSAHLVTSKSRRRKRAALSNSTAEVKPASPVAPVKLDKAAASNPENVTHVTATARPPHKIRRVIIHKRPRRVHAPNGTNSSVVKLEETVGSNGSQSNQLVAANSLRTLITTADSASTIQPKFCSGNCTNRASLMNSIGSTLDSLMKGHSKAVLALWVINQPTSEGAASASPGVGSRIAPSTTGAPKSDRPAAGSSLSNLNLEVKKDESGLTIHSIPQPGGTRDARNGESDESKSPKRGDTLALSVKWTRHAAS